MITGVYSATLIVRDQDKALDFYTNTLGFDTLADIPMGEGMRWLVVAPRGTKYGIALITPGFAGKDESADTTYNGINLVAKDVQQTYEELSAKGVKFTMPPEPMPWGALGAHFTDLDGNTFFVSEEEQA